MKTISLFQPRKVVFGTGCITQFCDDYLESGLKRLFLLTAPPVLSLIEETIRTLRVN